MWLNQTTETAPLVGWTDESWLDLRKEIMDDVQAPKSTRLLSFHVSEYGFEGKMRVHRLLSLGWKMPLMSDVVRCKIKKGVCCRICQLIRLMLEFLRSKSHMTPTSEDKVDLHQGPPEAFIQSALGKLAGKCPSCLGLKSKPHWIIFMTQFHLNLTICQCECVCRNLAWHNCLSCMTWLFDLQSTW